MFNSLQIRFNNFVRKNLRFFLIWKKRHIWQIMKKNFESIFLLRKFWFFGHFLCKKGPKKVKNDKIFFLSLYNSDQTSEKL